MDINTKDTTSYYINIYTNKGILVNNLYSIELTKEFKKKIRTLIETNPNNPVARLFLNTFK